jgi:hypothetical protein
VRSDARCRGRKGGTREEEGETSEGAVRREHRGAAELEKANGGRCLEGCRRRFCFGKATDSHMRSSCILTTSHGGGEGTEAKGTRMGWPGAMYCSWLDAACCMLSVALSIAPCVSDRA